MLNKQILQYVKSLTPEQLRAQILNKTFADKMLAKGKDGKFTNALFN